MKRNLLLLFTLFVPMFSQAQLVTMFDEEDTRKGIVVDQVSYEVVYDLTEVVSKEKDKRQQFNEPMLLQIGPKCSSFFSYRGFQADSLVKAQFAKGETNVRIPFSSQVSWKVLAHYPTPDRSVYLDKVANGRYRVEETLDTPEWEIVPDSALRLLGYDCRLATAKYRGRVWSAWYAEDIPLSHGPWKLHGLPGLILKAYDAGREFVFTASALRPVSEPKDMVYYGADYELIKRKDLNKIYRSYYADAIGYTLMSFPAGGRKTLKIHDEQGNVLTHSKPQPYNLIE